MPTNYNPDTDAIETMQERFAREAEVDERIIRRRKNTGGAAFPCRVLTGGLHANDEQPPTAIHPGMTLRDYFAAKSMAAQLQCEFPSVIPEKANGMSVAEFVAYQAYAMADAMLKAREA